MDKNGEMFEETLQQRGMYEVLESSILFTLSGANIGSISLLGHYLYICFSVSSHSHSV